MVDNYVIVKDGTIVNSIDDIPDVDVSESGSGGGVIKYNPTDSNWSGNVPDIDKVEKIIHSDSEDIPSDKKFIVGGVDKTPDWRTFDFSASNFEYLGYQEPYYIYQIEFTESPAGINNLANVLKRGDEIKLTGTENMDGSYIIDGFDYIAETKTQRVIFYSTVENNIGTDYTAELELNYGGQGSEPFASNPNTYCVYNSEDDTYEFTEPNEGDIVYSKEDNEYYVYRYNMWIPFNLQELFNNFGLRSYITDSYADESSRIADDIYIYNTQDKSYVFDDYLLNLEAESFEGSSVETMVGLNNPWIMSYINSNFRYDFDFFVDSHSSEYTIGFELLNTKENSIIALGIDEVDINYIYINKISDEIEDSLQIEVDQGIRDNNEKLTHRLSIEYNYSDKYLEIFYDDELVYNISNLRFEDCFLYPKITVETSSTSPTDLYLTDMNVYKDNEYIGSPFESELGGSEPLG